MPWFFYIFFIVSFLINFNEAYGDTSSDSSSESEEPDFKAEGCFGQVDTNKKCEEYENETAESTESEGGAETASTGGAEPTGAEEGAEKVCSSSKAVECCSDPTTCLGGSMLSTFESINTAVTIAGPGLGTGVQALGKDMSAMCELMQGLAGGGAAISLAAATKCQTTVSSCRSSCDSAIEAKCHEYNMAKKTCLTTKSTTSDTDTNAEEEFKLKAEPIAKAISIYEKTKVECSAQRAKSTEIMENMAQMATAAASAEICKQQARAIRDKEECEKAGGTWSDGECKMPEDNDKNNIPVLQLDDTPVSPGSGESTTLPTESPPEDDNNNDNNNEESGDTDKDDTVLGGGDKEPVLSEYDPGYSPELWLFGPDSEDSDRDNTGTASGGHIRAKSIGGLGGKVRSGQNDKSRKQKEDDNNLSLGGGGFSGYGSGKGGRGGSGDDDSSYGSLGLSKKKLAELEKKKGALRTTASESKGAHQNIFERISKRFQSLCQQRKLDCR